jgi:hypothetical protein
MRTSSRFGAGAGGAVLPAPRFRLARALRALALGTALASLGGPASLAWTDTSRATILRGAIRLMPDTLRQMLVAHQQELMKGMLSPGTPEDRPEHWQHPAGDYGAAAQQAEKEALAVAAAMDSHRPLSEVVRRFGTLAHWIADINDPLHAADRDPNLATYYRDYQSFLEESVSRYPLVFLGYRSPTLSGHGPGRYLLESAERSREYAESVRAAYHPDGTRVSKQAFDERSLAFGVGSLSFSNAVNDIARVWLWAWERCHGDTSGTPYPLEPGTSPAAEGRTGSTDTTRP